MLAGKKKKLKPGAILNQSKESLDNPLSRVTASLLGDGKN